MSQFERLPSAPDTYAFHTGDRLRKAREACGYDRKALAFFADNQKALNAANQQYNASFAASIAANGNASTIFSQINPGNSVTGKVVWDVPKGTTITKLELHDSAFSGGVAVNVG